MDAMCIKNCGREKCIQSCVASPIEKRLLVRIRRREEVSIETNLEEIWCSGLYWIQLVQDGVRYRVYVIIVVNI
jgi:hypothetical protein